LPEYVIPVDYHYGPKGTKVWRDWSKYQIKARNKASAEKKVMRLLRRIDPEHELRIRGISRHMR
jgi:hypothetical protein